MHKLLAISAALLTVSCSHGTCNNLPQREVAQEGKVSTTGPELLPVDEPAKKAEAPAKPEKRLPSIEVFKATGELQCGETKGLTQDEMKSFLTKNKISVYEGRTQSDGMMHMTLCGSPSGKIHIFSIPKKDLKRAEKLGFKTWVGKKS